MGAPHDEYRSARLAPGLNVHGCVRRSSLERRFPLGKQMCLVSGSRNHHIGTPHGEKFPGGQKGHRPREHEKNECGDGSTAQHFHRIASPT
jgi:hypothetical protein